MKKLSHLLLFLAVAAALSGCAAKSEGPQPIQEGDYASEPGGAAKTK